MAAIDTLQLSPHSERRPGYATGPGDANGGYSTVNESGPSCRGIMGFGIPARMLVITLGTEND